MDSVRPQFAINGCGGVLQSRNIYLALVIFLKFSPRGCKFISDSAISPTNEDVNSNPVEAIDSAVHKFLLETTIISHGSGKWKIIRLHLFYLLRNLIELQWYFLSTWHKSPQHNIYSSTNEEFLILSRAAYSCTFLRHYSCGICAQFEDFPCFLGQHCKCAVAPSMLHHPKMCARHWREW